MKKKYYFLASLAAYGILILSSCGGGGGGDGISQEQPVNQQPSEPVAEKPQPGTPTDDVQVITTGNTLYSVNGTAQLIFTDGVIISNAGSLNPEANNRGTTIVLVPHTGSSSILLNINDPDSTLVYVLGDINNSPLTQHNFFGINSGGQKKAISGYDTLLQQDLTNYQAVEVQITNNQGTLDWKFQDNTGNSEGQTFTVSNMRVANLISQGSNNIIDVGDYFETYKIQFNALPVPSIVGTADCPVYKASTRYEIPPTKDCVSFQFQDPDSAGSNPQYSLDGTNFNAISYAQTYNATGLNLNGGDTYNLSIIVKETLDTTNNITDQKTVSFTIYKDKNNTGNTSLTATCNDTTTGNRWNVNDNGSCEFVDPGDNQNAGTITVSGSSAPNGNCTVEIWKDNNKVSTVTNTCNAINASYTVPASDKGTGNHTLVFKVYKEYSTGTSSPTTVQIDQFTITYKVNQPPTINP